MTTMPSTLQAFMGIGFFFFVSLTVEGRNVPIDAKLQPEWLGHSDRSVLIPGIGRVMVPKKGSHPDPFNYNPITGAPGKHDPSIPGVGGSPGEASGHNYVPGTKLQPEWLGHSDRSVLIPGIGRIMVPKKGSHFKSFNYNPITGAPGGYDASIPGVGGSPGGASGHNYVPGGDDTTLPNPGVEVPNPVGGGIPAPSGP